MDDGRRCQREENGFWFTKGRGKRSIWHLLLLHYCNSRGWNVTEQPTKRPGNQQNIKERQKANPKFREIFPSNIQIQNEMRAALLCPVFFPAHPLRLLTFRLCDLVADAMECATACGNGDCCCASDSTRAVLMVAVAVAAAAAVAAESMPMPESMDFTCSPPPPGVFVVGDWVGMLFDWTRSWNVRREGKELGFSLKGLTFSAFKNLESGDRHLAYIVHRQLLLRNAFFR